MHTLAILNLQQMRKILVILAISVMAIAFTGCTMTKQLAYFQNIDSVDLTKGMPAPQTRVKVNDELTILVSSINPKAAEPFNMNLSNTYTNNSMAGNSAYSYIVDPEGNINFPVLGKLNVLGLTRVEVEDKIASLIKPYFAEEENPVVKVRTSNFKVTIIGEAGARVVNVTGERLSIVELLAQSGDISMYGKRKNIMLIRENSKGEKMVRRYDINDAEILNSPYYFLEQNDIVYVEPRKIKARSADISSWTFWTPLTSLALSLSTMIISLTK